MIDDKWFKENRKPWIIAGPCSAESKQQLSETTQALFDQGITVIRAGVWKPRTRPNQFEGAGIKALSWMQEIKKSLPVKFATEVATAKHVDLALKHNVDIVWIGARTTANPFIVQEIADSLEGTNIPILIKNPINPDLSLWLGAIERIERVGMKMIAAVHRGFSSFGTSVYRNEPLWQIPYELKQRIKNIPLICDPSHISGNREMIFDISQKAMDLSYDGLMIESHLDPDNALSDANQQIQPSDLHHILKKLQIREIKGGDITSNKKLDLLRTKIDSIDQDLLETLSARMHTVEMIANHKMNSKETIIQLDRWNEIMKSRVEWSKKLDLSADFIEELYKLIHTESIKRQTDIINPSIENSQ